MNVTKNIRKKEIRVQFETRKRAKIRVKLQLAMLSSM